MRPVNPAGTDYIVNSIEVSGIDCVRFDNDIPLEFGVSQNIGDTIGHSAAVNLSAERGEDRKAFAVAAEMSP